MPIFAGTKTHKMKPTIKDLQQKLNMANKTVAELMEQNAKLIQSNDLHVNENLELSEQIDELKQRLTDTTTDKMKYFNRCGEIAAINEKLFEENAQLKDDLVNANSDIEKLIKSVNEVTAAQQQTIIYNNCTFYNK